MSTKEAPSAAEQTPTLEDSSETEHTEKKVEQATRIPIEEKTSRKTQEPIPAATLESIQNHVLSIKTDLETRLATLLDAQRDAQLQTQSKSTSQSSDDEEEVYYSDDDDDDQEEEKTRANNDDESQTGSLESDFNWLYVKDICCCRRVIEPRDNFYVGWLWVLGLFVFLLCVAVPLDAGFPNEFFRTGLAVPVNWNLYHVLVWLGNLFFLIDIFVCCRLAYYNDVAKLIKDDTKILENYIRTWLVVDLLCVTPLFVDAGEHGGIWAFVFFTIGWLLIALFSSPVCRCRHQYFFGSEQDASSSCSCCVSGGKSNKSNKSNDNASCFGRLVALTLFHLSLSTLSLSLSLSLSHISLISLTHTLSSLSHTLSHCPYMCTQTNKQTLSHT